jgi:SAM-dependent methyltransferase
VVDWGNGRYERTAAELEPASQAVVALAAPQAGERVVDIACGTGNAALLAAARGADVVGIDASERLLGVARERATAACLSASFVIGDLSALPVADASSDVVLSVFGVIFAADPAAAVSEIARVLRPGARAYVSAWVPRGPIDAMVSLFGRTMTQITGASADARFPWSQTEAVTGLAAPHGLRVSTTPAELEIRAPSATAYVDDGWEHPMVIGALALLQRAGVVDRLRGEMIALLTDSSEDPHALLLHSPYVIHELHAGHTG